MTPVAAPGAVLGAQRAEDGAAVLGAQRPVDGAAVLGARRGGTGDDTNAAGRVATIGAAAIGAAALAASRKKEEE